MPDSAAQLHRCTLVTEEDIRALHRFLRLPNKTEGQFQRLIETHTGILGALGYSQFFSEYRVYKRDEMDVILDGRRKDRIDILAIKESELRDQDDIPYKSAHIIELKKAHEQILFRFDGLRLSQAAKDGIEQLRNYAEWLTTVEDNRQALKKHGVSMLRPGMHLVIGSEGEFAERPGLLEALREDCIQTHGVHLLLVEEVLRQADRMRAMQYVSMEGVLNLRAPSISVQPLILASSGLAGLVMLARNLLNKKRSVYGNIVMRDGPYEGLHHITGKRLQPLARSLNIPFAEAVVDFSQYGKLWKAITDGIVVALPDSEAIERAIAEREQRNTEEVRERRRLARARREEKYTHDFAMQVRERFPSLPEGEEFAIASRATEVGSGRVGRSHMVDDPIIFAVGAHARWNYTDYPDRLDSIHEEYRLMERYERRYMPPPADVAKRSVHEEVKELLEKWSKPKQDPEELPMKSATRHLDEKRPNR